MFPASRGAGVIDGPREPELTPPVQERFVEAEGVSLRVVSEGEGAPALVLHGFTGCVESMACVSERLSARLRVHRVDLLGHGRSSSPDAVEPFKMSHCVAQLTAVLDALSIDRVVVIGYSMGGRAALSLAVAHPERIAGLILVGATPGLADPEQRADRRNSDEKLADEIVRDGLEPFIDRWMAKPLFASQVRLGQKALDQARAQRLAGSAHGWAQSLRGLGTGAMPPLHSELPNLETPVLCVVGEEDAKFRAIAEQMVAALPSGCLRVLAQAGHAAHLEQPEAFAMAVNEFLLSGLAEKGSRGEPGG